jgi:hypothetical protein
MSFRPDRTCLPLAAVLLGLLALRAAAQEEGRPPQSPATRPAADRHPIQAQRVKDHLAFLASDALLGRDSPSPGLERAADYLAAAFRKAGLEPAGDDGTFFQTYRVPGKELAIEGLALAVEVEGAAAPIPLVSGQDLRLWSVTRGVDLRTEAPILVDEDDAAARLVRAQPRQPVLILVADDSPLWRAAEPGRRVIPRRRTLSSAPVLLVRRSKWPAAQFEACSIVVPEPRKAEIELRNVVALWPGTTQKDEFVLFSAHYDHIGVGLPRRGDAIHNGADDDASGSTGVLALAEAFGSTASRPRRSILFVCFSAEEKGMLGSKAFADDPPVPLAKIRVCINLEMLGRPPPEARKAAWLTGREYSDLAPMARAALGRGGVELVDFPLARQLFRASDNISLARKGVVAHSISAGSLHADYHQPSDELEKIDFEHMTAVLRGLFVLGQELADREGGFVYNEVGREVLGLDR